MQRHPASPRYHHAAALDTGFDCARDFAGGGSTEGGDEFVRTASITELDAADISVIVVAVILSEQQGEAREQRKPIVGETQPTGLLADLNSINEFFKDWMNAGAGKVHGQRNSVPHAGRDIAMIHSADAYSIGSINVVFAIVAARHDCRAGLYHRAPR